MKTLNQIFRTSSRYASISRKGRTSDSSCHVAVIGAGPYGLAAAAHLKSAGIDTRVFGDTMAFWRANMPTGMFLRHATDIADPAERFSFDVYMRATNSSYKKPVAIQNFIAYGEWFQQQAIGFIDARKVVLVRGLTNGFRLELEDGEVVQTTHVVLAMGLANQAFRPAEFVGIGADLVSHTSEHTDFGRFRSRRVAVIGRGQSACESAALLQEAGAKVEIICRDPIHWIGSCNSLCNSRKLRRRVQQVLTPKSAIGPFPLNWLVDKPGYMHRLSPRLRDRIGSRSLRPAATGWLRPRMNEVQISAGCDVRDVRNNGETVTLGFADSSSSSFDHVLLATGYRIDIAKFGVLTPELLGRIHTADGSPILTAGCESSVPGLHFIGASAVQSFGPMLRFVAGTGYAARAVTRAVLARAPDYLLKQE